MNSLKILMLAVYNDSMVEAEELGIGYIASYLRKYGYKVKIIGTNIRNIDYDDIVGFHPDIIAIPTYIVSLNSIYDVCINIKQRLSDVSICLGGYIPTYYSNEIMEEALYVDFIIKGEGEEAFLELAQSIERGAGLEGVKGLVYRCNNRIISNKKQGYIHDIDSLPLPDREYVLSRKMRYCNILTSRGCKGNCSFCWSNEYWEKWRERSAENVVDEIEYIVNQYGIDMFYFIDNSYDDCERQDHSRIKKIAEELINRNLKISYSINIRSNFYRKINKELFELIKKSGLIGAYIGIESGNENDLILYKKQSTKEDNNQIVRLFKNSIVTEIGFININPYSTFSKLTENIDFLGNNGFASDISLIRSTYRNYKGTELYYRLESDGLAVYNDKHIDMYGYKFVDERIGILTGYLNKHIDLMAKENDNIVNRFNFTGILAITSHLKRKFYNYDEICNALLKFEHDIFEICSQLNGNNVKWFKELLLLAQAGWNSEKADRIMDYYLNIEQLEQCVSQLEKSKSKLFFTLCRRAPEKINEISSYF